MGCDDLAVTPPLERLKKMTGVTIIENELIPHELPLAEQMELLETIVAIMHAERIKWQGEALTLDLPPDKMELPIVATIQEGENND